MKLKLLQSGQAQEHEECINCLYALSSMAQHCVYPFLAVVTIDCFVVIKDVPVANATGCRAI